MFAGWDRTVPDRGHAVGADGRVRASDLKATAELDEALLG